MADLDLFWDSGVSGILRAPLFYGLIIGLVAVIALGATRDRVGRSSRADATLVIGFAVLGSGQMRPVWSVVLALVLIGVAAFGPIARTVPTSTVLWGTPPPTSRTGDLLVLGYLGIVLVGFYGVLPDNEPSLAAFGALLCFAAYMVLRGDPPSRLEVGWSTALVALLVIVVLDGAVYGQAHVGGLASIGALWVGVPRWDRRVQVGLLPVHVAWVIYASRGAGLQESAGAALEALALPVLAVSMLGLACFALVRATRATAGAEADGREANTSTR